MKVEPGYEDLARVLQAALDQSQNGKGKERHNPSNLPFTEQPIMTIARMVGPGGPAQQVMKKTQEALRLPPEAAERELLGAIVYAAAAILIIREQQHDISISDFLKHHSSRNS